MLPNKYFRLHQTNKPPYQHLFQESYFPHQLPIQKPDINKHIDTHQWTNPQPTHCTQHHLFDRRIYKSQRTKTPIPLSGQITYRDDRKVKAYSGLVHSDPPLLYSKLIGRLSVTRPPLPVGSQHKIFSWTYSTYTHTHTHHQNKQEILSAVYCGFRSERGFANDRK